MIYLLFIRLALACDTTCEEACSVLNGPSSCYRNCGCKERELLVIDSRIKENFKDVVGKVLRGTDCLFERYEKCLEVGGDKIKKCIVREHCEVLMDFVYLTREIPTVLWMAISPPVLEKYFEKEQGISYHNLDLCQRDCYKNGIGKGVTKFEKYENCIGKCEEQFDKDFDGSCSYNCFMNCMKKGDECLDSCLGKDCGIIEGKKIERKIGGFKLKSYDELKEDL